MGFSGWRRVPARQRPTAAWRTAAWRTAAWRSALTSGLLVAAVSVNLGVHATAATASPRHGATDELVEVVLPYRGFSQAGVAGVACTSPTWCVAVGTGSANHGSTQLASLTGLVWTYGGREWRLSARLPIAESSLASVSCVSRSFCMAVGRAGNPYSRVLAARWNGRSWSQVTAASPLSSGNGDALASVDCLSRSACWAIGGVDLGEGGALPHDLIEHWSGRVFATVVGPSTGNALVAIGCSSAVDCWASSYPSGAKVSTNEVEHYARGAWRRATIPLIPLSLSGGASGIACRTTATCWMVGARTVNGELPASVHLVRGAWEKVSMQAPKYPDVFLQGIACAPAGDCWSVGGNTLVGPGVRPPYKEGAFAEHWGGSSWQIATVSGAPAARYGSLVAASCAGSGFCVAGGETLRGAPLVAVSHLLR